MRPARRIQHKTRKSSSDKPQQQTEVVAAGTEHGALRWSRRISWSSLRWPIRAQWRRDSHLLGRMVCVRNPADLAADPDLEPIGIGVSAIALIAVDAAHRNTCERFEISADGAWGPSGRHRGCPCSALGMQHELAAPGRGKRGDNPSSAAVAAIELKELKCKR